MSGAGQLIMATDIATITARATVATLMRGLTMAAIMPCLTAAITIPIGVAVIVTVITGAPIMATAIMAGATTDLTTAESVEAPAAQAVPDPEVING